MISVRIFRFLYGGPCHTEKYSYDYDDDKIHTYIIRCYTMRFWHNRNTIPHTFTAMTYFRWTRTIITHPPSIAGSTAAPAAMCPNRTVRRFHLIRMEQPRSVAFTILHRFSLCSDSLSKLCIAIFCSLYECVVGYDGKKKRPFQFRKEPKIHLLRLMWRAFFFCCSSVFSCRTSLFGLLFSNEIAFFEWLPFRSFPDHFHSTDV